jgi:hypothetical protein
MNRSSYPGSLFRQFECYFYKECNQQIVRLWSIVARLNIKVKAKTIIDFGIT